MRNVGLDLLSADRRLPGGEPVRCPLGHLRLEYKWSGPGVITIWGEGSGISLGICSRVGEYAVVFSEIDRNLLERCLARKPRSWEDFVDRFLGLFYHVVDHTAAAANIKLSPDDRDDICAEIFLRLIENDFAILRRFRGQASLATYLAVVGRRIAVRLLRERAPARRTPGELEELLGPSEPLTFDFASREEVEKLLENLPEGESKALRLFYLEGKSYTEIARELGVAENTVGPILSRARERLRRQLATHDASSQKFAD